MNRIFKNELGIPAPLARCIELMEDDYFKGEKVDFSVTEILGPPRIRALSRAMKEVTVEVGDRMHAVSGSATHSILERLSDAEPGRYLTEKRFFREIDGVRISGQIDLYDFEERALYDWKQTRWATYANGVKWEYVAQLNLCRWLAADELEVDRLWSCAIFRDYSKSTYQFKPPHKPAEQFEVPVWTDADCEELLRTRIQIHRQAEQVLPSCTPEEKWQQDDSYAVEPMKGGRARKVCKTRGEAEEWRQKQKSAKSLVVVHRPGKCVRCQDYCPVASICQDWLTNPMNPKNNPQ
jgi:hypothetical protein